MGQKPIVGSNPTPSATCCNSAFDSLAEYKAEPVYWARQTGLAVVAARSGHPDQARALLAEFKAKNSDASSYQYAQILTQLGDKQAALDALEHALVVRDAGLLLMHTDPLMGPIRNDIRFQTVEKRLQGE